MHFKAVCFDLDGTLLDSLTDLTNCTNKILSKRGFPEHPESSFRSFIGDGAEMLITRALPANARGKSIIEECIADFEKTYRECWNETTVPFPNIPELLDSLCFRKLKLTVLSNKPHEFTKLAVRELLPRWNFEIVLGERKGFPRKPDPEGIFEISEDLSIPSDEFVFIGDTANDMKTGLAAGCLSVGVLWGLRSEEELRDNGANFIIKDPLELLDLLV